MPPERALIALDTAPEWDREMADLVKATVCKGATDLEFQLFAATCRRTGLDPLARQIYSVRRRVRDGDTWREAQVTQVSIDGFRLLAERTGHYGGQLGPDWCGPDGIWREVWLDKEPPAAARCGVVRTDWAQPLYAVARWSSYVQTDRNGSPTAMWARMPDVMLAKCFSPETEVLTDRGFQPFPSVSGRILQVTDYGLEPTDARPFVQRWDGPMVVLDSDDLNFCVTPNHDLLTTAGKIEAGDLFEAARSRPRHWIPRCISGTRTDYPLSDAALQLTAAYVADGFDTSQSAFKIAVSRPRKVALLEGLALHTSRRVRPQAGLVARTATRIITTRHDQELFHYAREIVEPLIGPGKVIRPAILLQLSRRQARLFVDTLIAFDGSTRLDTITRRYYSSRADHVAAFEIATVAAGYAVGPQVVRQSDIGQRPNTALSVSHRSEIPIVRWGRAYHRRERDGQDRYTGLQMRPNAYDTVWCVTVPSGVIVVRRNGFSMQCGNCAESLALRRAFPAELSGLYSAEELAQADNDAPEPAPMRGGATPVRALPAGKPPSGAYGACLACGTVGALDEVTQTCAGDQECRALLEQRFAQTVDAALAAPRYPWTKAGLEVFFLDAEANLSLSKEQIATVFGGSMKDYCAGDPELGIPAIGLDALYALLVDLAIGNEAIPPREARAVTATTAETEGSG